MAELERIAATGCITSDMIMNVKANNIALKDANAFAPSQVVVVDNPYMTLKMPGSPVSDGGQVLPTGIQVGLGGRVAGTYRVQTQGAYRETGNPYDLYIDGPGYFKVTLLDGTEGYMRDGTFMPGPDGVLVTPEGYILGDGITIPKGTLKVDINEKGEVLATIDGQVQPQNIGNIKLSTFNNPGGLRAVGNNVFLVSGASGDAIEGNAGSTGFGSILQGGVEESGVQMVIELSDMIKAQHTYEACSNIIKMGREKRRMDAGLVAG
ncbi:Flagellar basal-body rod protein FlgG [Candidatus Bealeia paramacronuclearis]|uniref:Flagellar basal-body rod protein FlgG n=1 Tax=Candidatus Bealeia paramacronuclearis TaxID=1921001 RepID=A0ABZ2C3Q1_9PROT|nr:Flagellar basal-body rod protein FlgG [Candidatus Bealeia paramacronuclearis]